MGRDSFIFYRSFYESIKELPEKNRLEIYEAIFEKEFHSAQVELEGISKAIYTLILPQLEANDKRYENGRKGGRPKKNQKETETKPNDNQNKTKLKPNVNDNVNDNVLLLHTTTLYDFVEENFCRTLSSVEVMTIDEWLSWFEEDIIKHAIKISILNNKKTFNYVNGILKNWKSCGYKTLQEIKDIETKREKKEEKKVELFDYDWLNE
jgi:DnaD/phage-associated family protein